MALKRKNGAESGQDEWELIQQKKALFEIKAKQTEEERQALIESQQIFFDKLRSKLDLEKNLLNEEKASMTKELMSDNDIIRLNVGGDKFNARRDTLCLCKDSLLASMFSGRWEESLPKLLDGRIYLDYDPECFRKILNRLRQMRLTQCCSFPIPKDFQSSEQKEDFFALAKYLGLFSESATNDLPCFENSNINVMISNNGKTQVVEHCGDLDDPQFVQTQVLKFVDAQAICWKVRIPPHGHECLDTLVGIISKNSKGNDSSSSPTCYAWHYDGVVMMNGIEYVTEEWSGWKSNDEAQMSLDPSGILRMSLKRASDVTCHQINVGQMPEDGWRIHINLFCVNDKVEVSPACPYDFEEPGEFQDECSAG